MLYRIDAELAGPAHSLDIKLQKFCESGYSLFAVHMLVKRHHFNGVN